MAFTPLLFVSMKLVLMLVLLLVFVLLFCVFYFVYVTVLEGFWGRTLGKALSGIEVIREEDGGVPELWRAALWAMMVLFGDMFIGILVMLASPRGQRPGDLTADTLVVPKKRDV